MLGRRHLPPAAELEPPVDDGREVGLQLDAYRGVDRLPRGRGGWVAEGAWNRLNRSAALASKPIPISNTGANNAAIAKIINAKALLTAKLWRQNRLQTICAGALPVVTPQIISMTPPMKCDDRGLHKPRLQGEFHTMLARSQTTTRSMQD